MATEDSDPIDWGVDEVVAFLCNPESAPWAQSVNSARPDPVALEAALRENFIAGEALLHDVDSDAIKHDLGVKALGHRSSITRAIEWLRLRSLKYQMSKKSFPSLDETPAVRTSHDGTLSSHRSTPAPAPFNSATLNSSKSSNPEAPLAGPHNRRRIAPTLVTGSEELNIRQAAARLSGDPAQLVTRGIPSHGHSPPATDAGGFDDTSADHIKGKQIPSSASSGTKTGPFEVNSGWFTTRLEEDILQRHPPGKDDEDALPVYGESGSENEYDTEGWRELLDEQPHLAHEGPDSHQLQPSTSLPHEVVESLVSQYIKEQEEVWKKESLPKEVPYARPLWERSREGDNLHHLTEEISSRLHDHDRLLMKFKKAIFDCQYKSKSSVWRSCPTLDQTLDRIFLDRWRLSILEQDICPPAVELPPRAPRTRKPRSSSVHSADSEHSEDLGIGSESDVPSESDDMNDFIVEDSDDTEQPGAEARRGLPFTLASSPSSDDGGHNESESASPAHKKRRVVETDEYYDMDDDVEVVDLTGSDFGLAGGTSLRRPLLPQIPAVPDEAQRTEDADEMEIATPPLNPVPPVITQDADMVDELSLGIQPLHPVSDSQSPDSSLQGHLQAQDGTERFPASSQGEPDNRDLTVSLDDIDLFSTLANWSLKSIETTKNRIHLLAKTLIVSLTEDEFKQFPSFLAKFIPAVYNESVQEALQAMLNNDRQLEGRDPGESKLAMRMGALFVSWYHCIALQPVENHKELIQGALEAIKLDEHENMFAIFFQRLKGLIAAAKVWKSRNPSHRSPDEEHKEVQPRLMLTLRYPNAKKRRSAPRTPNSQQKEAQERQARQEQAREALRRKREEEGLSNSDPAGQAVTFKDPIIYLPPLVGQFVKPHQLVGIQFMWREIIEAEKPQGCLLAHVMGLGKTMQVISLLMTIAAAAASDDPKIREQVPQKFHRSQTLVLCPSPVVENWVDEFAIWNPEDTSLGPVRDIIPRGRADEVAERVAAIKAWNDEGGVLIMSYDMLRTIIQNKTTRQAKRLGDEEHARVQEWLLVRPNIVVADEAHKLKNNESAISKIASSFKSMSRIAITGSPLANHLSEYYQMVDWVAPGYLEDQAAFKSKFMDPIQAGSYMDSTVQQQRESLVALKLLNGILSPKVLRADTSAIASDLPSKTEFILYVSLTDLQRQAYDVFVHCLTANPSADVSTKLWSWLGLLQLCCNHPFPFREKLADRYRQSEYSETGDAETGSVLPRLIQDAGLPSVLLPRIEELFSSVPDLRDPRLSNRSLLLTQILDESLKVGDKVLIFSQSIPTMNYLDDLLKQCGHSFSRIDGSTPGSDRQATSKRFNTTDDEQILLISTRAGGLGLNMYGANRVIIFDFLFNPTWEEQAVGRAYRLGQKKPVFVYRFVAGGTFEEIIFKNAVFKSQLAVRVVDKKNVVRESAKQSTRYLFPVRQTVKGDCTPILGKDPQVLDKVLTGSYGDIILKASLSQIQDNENDRLTEAERQRVDDELSMELLKRSDPEEYAKEKQRRSFAEIQKQQAEARSRVLEQQRLLREPEAARQQHQDWWHEQRSSELRYQPFNQWQQQQQDVLQNQRGLDSQMQQRRAAQIQRGALMYRQIASAVSSPSTNPSITAAPPGAQSTGGPSDLSAPAVSGESTTDITSEPMDISEEEADFPSTSFAGPT